MLYLPLLVTLLTSAPPEPRLEVTARAGDARRLAASVLVDADAIADVVVLDGAALFEVELGGERHELRVELDGRGAVVGASVWWLGDAAGDDRWDLGAALPALLETESLDAVHAGDVLTLEAGGERAPLALAGEPADGC